MWNELLSIIGLANKNLPSTAVSVDEEPVVALTLRAQVNKAASELITMVDTGAVFSYREASKCQTVCCKENVVILFSHISDIVDILQNGGRLNPPDTFAEMRACSVKDIMINNGYYVPIEIVRMLGVKYCEMADLLKNSDGTSGGIPFHNTRLLNSQLTTGLNVCSSLTACYVH